MHDFAGIYNVYVREKSNIPMSYLDPFCLLVLEINKRNSGHFLKVLNILNMILFLFRVLSSMKYYLRKVEIE